MATLNTLFTIQVHSKSLNLLSKHLVQGCIKLKRKTLQQLVSLLDIVCSVLEYQ